MERSEITDQQMKALLDIEESQFVDLKSKDIPPGKLQKHLSAFSNADGGELYIGIDEVLGSRAWRGFSTQEDANGHIQILEKFFPLGTDYQYVFLSNPSTPGYVLQISAAKTREIKETSDGKIYLRRGAQSIPQTTSDEIERLKLNKGISSYENSTVGVDKDAVTDSLPIVEFLVDVIPTAEPEVWLKKQQLIRSDKPTVGGIVLFADEPQAILPKTCGVKIYRYQTNAAEGTRETLAFDPVTVEGHLYKQIKDAVSSTVAIIEELNVMGPKGLERAKYPTEALHEIVTNAVLHRDYSIPNDIHIRIFENRIEVESPGRLPGHITVENILDERFARNGAIVRIINKYPDAPNKDVGEGLNTAFQAMRRIELKEPQIEELPNAVKVTLRHEPVAPPEDLVMQYLESNNQINNAKGREICFIGSENRMKRVFEKLMEKDLIERIPELRGNATAYRKK